MSEANGRTHLYHAEATILEGHLELPLAQPIHRQAHAALPEQGGYISQRQEDFRIEGVLSFRSAYTQVAGNHDVKPGHGWSTLTTMVIEGLNILEVLTADRIVGQISTEHPLEGYVPSVSFLGTRFENLRIAGHPVSLDINHDILGSTPAQDGAYTLDPALHSRVSQQYKQIQANPDLPSDLQETYNQLSSTLGAPEAVECSLVNHAVGGYPGKSFGHVIRVPNYGTITLGRVRLSHANFSSDQKPKTTTVHLSMVGLALGCSIAGGAGLGVGTTNGQTRP